MIRLSAFWAFILLNGCFDDLTTTNHPCDACLPCERCATINHEAVCLADTAVKFECENDGNIHSFDGCDVDEGIAERCPKNASCIDDGKKGPACVCTHHWTGTDCNTCSGNFDPDRDCDECLPGWDIESDCETCLSGFDIATGCIDCIGNRDPNADCNVCLSNWDIESDCETCLSGFDIETGCIECIGNRDPNNNCELCRNHWVDDDNNCGTCSGNFDPDKDCNECLPNWDIESDCETCLPHFDIETGCTECIGNRDPNNNCELCRNHWVDNDDNCGTCPAHFDPTADCNACIGRFEGNDCNTCPGNWDEIKDCTECRNHWIDNNDNCGICPTHFDPAADCNDCRNHWTGTDCNTCPGNWNNAGNCDECRNHWGDNDDNCGTCPGHWDPAADCNLCLKGWDIATGCATCVDGYGETDECRTCEPGLVGTFCNLCVRYVKAGGDDAADGLTWASAKAHLFAGIEALSEALSEDSAPETCTLAVSKDPQTVFRSSTADTLLLTDGMALVGGFNGDEPGLIPSSDAKTDIRGASEDGLSAVLHVVTVDGAVTMDGFVVSDGNATGTEDEQNGGGIFIKSGSLTMTDCEISHNTADNFGGGIYVLQGDLTMDRCRIAQNNAYNGGGISVGNVEFTWSGETVGNLSLLNTIIEDNSAEGSGGGVQFNNFDGDFISTNTVWVRNHARLGGAAHLFGGNTILSFDHATITQNIADDLGGVAVYLGNLEIADSILWDNFSGSIEDPNGLYASSSEATVRYSLIYNYEGDGNFYADPLFAGEDDFTLLPGSPCIDAAYAASTQETDLRGYSRVDDPETPDSGGGTVSFADVGAYEYQPN